MSGEAEAAGRADRAANRGRIELRMIDLVVEAEGQIVVAATR